MFFLNVTIQGHLLSTDFLFVEIRNLFRKNKDLFRHILQ